MALENRTIQERVMAELLAKTGYVSAHINELWHKLFTLKGIALGQLAERKLAYALSLGAPVSDVTNAAAWLDQILSSISQQTMFWDSGAMTTLDSRITFIRAGTGTYFNSSGIRKVAAVDTPRLDYDPATLAPKGLLVEEARTNLLTFSEQFNNVLWLKGNGSIAQDIIPNLDGLMTADKWMEDTTINAFHSIGQVVSFTNGLTYTISFELQAAGRTECVLGFDPGAFGSYQYAKFNLTTGTATTFLGAPTFAIVALGGGRYKISVTATATVTVSANVWSLQLIAGGTNQYTGDGISGLYLYTAQMEVGAFPSSYIPTTNAAVTRPADIATMASLAPWYNQSEGTLVLEAYNANPQLNVTQLAVVLSDGTNNERMYLGKKFDSITVAEFGVTSGGVGQAFILSSPTTFSGFRMVGAYKLNDFATIASGGALTADGAGTPPTLTQAEIGKLGSNYFNGCIKRFAYFPTRKSNAELLLIGA